MDTRPARDGPPWPARCSAKLRASEPRCSDSESSASAHKQPCDAVQLRTRMRVAAFPVRKRLDEFDVAASSIPKATFDYLSSLEWIRAAENACFIGPAGTG